MRLNEPQTTTREFRAELDADLGYLTGDGSAPVLVFQCKPGGYLNTGYVAALEAADVARRADLLGFEVPKKDAQGKADSHATLERLDLERRLLALHDHCIESWSTNIQDGGKDMVCDGQHFVALAVARIPGATEAITELFAFTEKFTGFITKADEETVKN